MEQGNTTRLRLRTRIAVGVPSLAAVVATIGVIGTTAASASARSSQRPTSTHEARSTDPASRDRSTHESLVDRVSIDRGDAASGASSSADLARIDH